MKRILLVMAFVVYASSTFADTIAPHSAQPSVSATPAAVGSPINRKSLCVRNTHASTSIYCGENGDATKDMPIPAGQGYCFDTCSGTQCEADKVIQCETASGSATSAYEEAR